MLRQKRNLSAFRQFEAHVATISDEEYEISDYSEGENEENRCSSNTAGNSSNDCTAEKTISLRSSYCTPPSKRIKRTPLSTVRHKPLHIKRMSFHGSTTLFEELNSSTKKSNESRSTLRNRQDEDDSDEHTIEWLSSDESENVETQRPITVETQSTEKFLPASYESTQNSANSVSSAQKKKLYKRCRKGGYLHQLQQTMEQAKADRKFLEHDKKFGIRQYVSLRLLKVENSFGVHWATVISPTDQIFQIILSAEMAERIKPDSILESFVDQVKPYAIEHCDEMKQIIVQPCKIVLS